MDDLVVQLRDPKFSTGNKWLDIIRDGMLCACDFERILELQEKLGWFRVGMEYAGQERSDWVQALVQLGDERGDELAADEDE